MTFTSWDTTGDEPVYASRLNAGAFWFATDIADMKASNTTDLVTNSKVICWDTGDGDSAVYKFDKTSSETESLPDIVAPTTGGGRFFLEIPGKKTIEALIVALSGGGSGGSFGPPEIADIGSDGINELEFFRIHKGTVTVGTIAAQSVEDHTITISGVRSGDFVAISYPGPLVDNTDCMVGEPFAITDGVTIPFMNTSGTTSADLGSLEITVKIERYAHNGN